MAAGDGFGGAEEALLAASLEQEAQLSQLGEENAVLGATIEALQDKLRSAEGRAAAAAKRAAEAEARLRARAATAAGEGQQLVAAQEQAAQLKHKLTNYKIEAERDHRDAEQQLAAARRDGAHLRAENAALRSDNEELRHRLAAAQQQAAQLESLQALAVDPQEGRRREAESAAALDAANARARQLEGRCTELEAELASAAAALQAADARAAHPPPAAQERQGRADSLSASDLADLDGVGSQWEGPAGPQNSPLRSSGAMRLTRQRVHPQRQRQAAAAAAEEQAGEAQLGLLADLQVQLLGQQRQLAALQAQQEQAHGGWDPPLQQADGEQAAQVAALEQQVEKLKRRNTQMQTALAEASLTHARAAAAAQKALQEAQAEAAQLRQACGEAEAQLAALQAAAASFESEDGACSPDRLGQLHEELIEMASRCNAAVEQNAGLLQEKTRLLEKLKAAETVAERAQAEAQQLRLGRLTLLPGGAFAGSGGASSQELLDLLLEARVAEAALRGVLLEARDEQTAAARALSSELRRGPAADAWAGGSGGARIAAHRPQ